MKQQSFVRATRNLLLRCILVALGLGILSSQVQAGKRIVVERIVAVVNNEIVLWSDWKQRFAALQEPALQGILDDEAKRKRLLLLRDEVLQKMIDDILLDQVARKLQVNVTSKEVDAAILDTQRRYKLTPEQFREAQKQQGFTATTYRAMVSRELRKLRLLRRVLRDKVNVSEQDERAFYRRMIQDVNAGPTEYLVRHIQINVPMNAPAADVKKLRARAEAVLKDVTAKVYGGKKETFASLAKKFSQEGVASQSGGSLGWHKTKFDDDEEETLHTNLMKALRKTKVGKIYPRLIRTPLGFHLLYVQEQRSSGVLSFEKARPNIQKILRKQAFEKAYVQYMKEIRRKAVVVKRLPPVAS